MPGLLKKIERRWRDAQSRRRFPPDKPYVAHARVGQHHLLVRANEDVGRTIHFLHDFERGEQLFFERVIRPTAICLDVGANIGFFTILMAGKATAGHVHAFEPLALNAALLAASIELNGFTNVSLVQSAVGAEDGEIAFSQAVDSAYSSIRDTGRQAEARLLTVPITRLDTYLNARAVGPIDIMKCDVEGAEGLVLDGAGELFSSYERQPAILMIELFQGNLDHFNTDVTRIEAQLTAAGYAAHTIAEDGSLRPANAPLPAGVYNHVFVAPRGRAALL